VTRVPWTELFWQRDLFVVAGHPFGPNCFPPIHYCSSPTSLFKGRPGGLPYLNLSLGLKHNSLFYLNLPPHHRCRSFQIFQPPTNPPSPWSFCTLTAARLMPLAFRRHPMSIHEGWNSPCLNDLRVFQFLRIGCLYQSYNPLPSRPPSCAESLRPSCALIFNTFVSRVST